MAKILDTGGTMDDHGHPSQEQRDFRQGDQALRRHGFRIARRPGKGLPNTWARPGGEEVTEEEAHRIVRQEMRDAAKKAGGGRSKKKESED